MSDDQKKKLTLAPVVVHLPELDELEYNGVFAQNGFGMRKKRQYIPVSQEHSYVEFSSIRYYGIIWNIPLTIGLIQTKIVTATNRETGESMEFLTRYLEVPDSINALS